MTLYAERKLLLMNTEGLTIAVTGHRTLKGHYAPSTLHDIIRGKLKNKLIELKPRRAISGMALGVDTLFTEACLDLGIPILAAVPHDGQEKIWRTKDQIYYHELLKKVSRVHVVTPGPYSPGAMHARNHFMVDHCDLLIAVWDGTKKGGTYACIQYAEKVNLEVFYITP